MAGTNIPPPIWNPATGFVSASEASILAGAQADIAQAFSSNTLNFALNTPQGQLSSSYAASVGSAQETFLFYTTQTDPAYAEGRMQDAIGRISFMERNGALPTVLQIQCNGSANLPIPTTAVVFDSNNNLYTCTQAGNIAGNGSVVLPFAANIPGPTPVPETVKIYTTIPGWDSATVISGAEGSNTETRAAFEQRRQDSVEKNATGIMGSIIGAVSAVTGVLDYFGIANNTSSPTTYLGVTIAANSIYVCVAGGSQSDVAQAILTKKPPGIPMTGNTTVTAYDNNPLYAFPIPYTILYEIPTNTQILFAVKIRNLSTVPSNALFLVQDALLKAFVGASAPNVSTAGASNPPRARIATLILGSSYMGVIQGLGPWAQVISIDVGSLTDSDAAIFTATATGSVLNVSAVASGTIAVGQNVIDTNGVIPAGVTIASFGSGTGGPGTYNLSMSVPTISVGETMGSVTADENSTQVNANQEPILQANNITLTLV